VARRLLSKHGVSTAAAFTGLRLARHALAQGLPRPTVSSWLGLRGQEIDGADRAGSLPRIPIDRLYAAWASLSRTLGDPAVGIRAAMGWTVADLDLLGFCVATAPTGGAALRTAVRYAALITDSGRWRMDEGADPVVLTWERTGPLTLGRAISNEAAVASFAVCFRELTAATPLALELRHAAPSRSSAHRDLLGCPVVFGADRDALLLARRDLDVVLRQANPALWRFLSAIADGELARLRPRSARALVERALATALDADRDRMPSAGDISRALGLSERTLRRRLRGEAIGFRALLDQVRRARASELLAEESASLTEVALASGFADVSGLGHAWRRWFGAAPSSTRRARATSKHRPHRR
jgi:AraC-like DNA-binding protein